MTYDEALPITVSVATGCERHIRVSSSPREE